MRRIIEGTLVLGLVGLVAAGAVAMGSGTSAPNVPAASSEVVAASQFVTAEPVSATEAEVAEVAEVAGATAAWVTSPVDADRRLVAAQRTEAPASRTIEIDLSDRRQIWRGVGAALTDSSTELLTGNDAALDLLFGADAADGAHLNLVRLPLSATDFSTDDWTWEVDAASGGIRPPGPALRSIDVVDDIGARIDDLAVAAAAWSVPPAFRSPVDDLDGVGASLRPGSEQDYAAVLAAQADWLVGQDVPLEWMSLGNEPGHVSDYPTTSITDDQLIELATVVGPTLDDLGVGLLAVDHNWADRDRVDTVLAGAPGMFDVAAFHCYAGEPGQMADLPVPALVTECTGTTDTWAGTFAWDARQLIAGSIDSGSIGLLLWNLALDPSSGPKADWGCADCRGLLTIDPATGSIEPGPEFFVLGHLARAAEPGSVVLGVMSTDDLAAAAFEHPDGTIGVVGHNAADTAEVIEVVASDGRAMSIVVEAGELFTVTV